jgi:23S rRNA (guanine745-N1)-methyltransferase
MDPQIVAGLRCPVCADRLVLQGRAPRGEALRCPAGHSFDVARHGYVDLSGGRITHEGDSAAMIAARERVLDAGHFDIVTRGLAAATTTYPRGLLVDVGAGTGHHLAALLEGRPEARGLALDVSKAALRRAARAHPRLAAVRADAWRGLPVADAAAAVILNVFAPRAGGEFARALAPGGRLVVVTPAADHLRELALPVRVDPAKEERLVAALAPWFRREDDREARATLRLSAPDADAVVAMGPSARHSGPPSAGRTATAQVIEVTAAVRITVWRHREEPDS